jgi:hypothetical protein
VWVTNGLGMVLVVGHGLGGGVVEGWRLTVRYGSPWAGSGAGWV